MSNHSLLVRLSTQVLSAALFCGLALASAHAQTYKVIYNAESANAGIENPASRVVTQGHDGDMYFTSVNGGTFYGTFFKTAASGSTTIVYPVQGFPTSGGTLGTDGNFYVTDQDEGPGGNCGFSGCGQVLKISANGTETVLYNFKGESDGSSPQSAPIQAANGVFYGTTLNDGESDGSSTAYSITSGGAFKNLHIFDGATEGSNVGAELLQASNGDFYGTAYYGGANGDGTIFKMTPTGTVTVLHSFNGVNNADGSNPCCGLIQAGDGNIYGATFGGGAHGNGLIFKLTLGGVYTQLYSLNLANGDGSGPGSTLTQGSDGKLYGVTSSGGGGVSGTLFNVTTSGTFKTLYTFCSSGSCSDGYGPSTPLKQNTNGTFYGATYTGGDLSACNSQGCGAVYSLSMGLKPFASLVNTTGQVGTAVGIRGQGFSSKSVVEFNGVTATSIKVQPTYISATVPTGATSGFVTVTTGTTKLTTLQKFTVK